MQNKYDILGIVGEGAYGIVMKCRIKETDEVVAIKKFKDADDEIVQKSMMRELKVLRKLKHDNIVRMRECFKKKGKLFLVFEYVEKNLLELLEQSEKGLSEALIKKVIYQICKGVVYMHMNDMIHRDIKPENVLVTENNTCKLCDFGFSRNVPTNKVGQLTDYVATRWYRAPELLLGSTSYGKEVDYWAIGCIMGELCDTNPMFPGDDELSQLDMVQKMLGNLPQKMLDQFNANPRFSGFKIETVRKPEMLERRYYGKLSRSAISFMKELLKLDPAERLSGMDVILHSWFDDIRKDDPEFSHLKREMLQNVGARRLGSEFSARSKKFGSSRGNLNFDENTSQSPRRDNSNPHNNMYPPKKKPSLVDQNKSNYKTFYVNKPLNEEVYYNDYEQKKKNKVVNMHIIQEEEGHPGDKIYKNQPVANKQGKQNFGDVKMKSRQESEPNFDDGKFKAKKNYYATKREESEVPVNNAYYNFLPQINVKTYERVEVNNMNTYRPKNAALGYNNY